LRAFGREKGYVAAEGYFSRAVEDSGAHWFPGIARSIAGGVRRNNSSARWNVFDARKSDSNGGRTAFLRALETFQRSLDRFLRGGQSF
jgi:hypothetical protein